MTQDPGNKGKMQKEEESPEGQCQEVLPERYCGLQVCVAPDSSVRREGLWKVPELRRAVRVGTSLTGGGREERTQQEGGCVQTT